MEFLDKKCPNGHEFKTTDEGVDFCPICDPEKFIHWKEGYFSPTRDFKITQQPINEMTEQQRAQRYALVITISFNEKSRG